jgi:hypothetical protein
MQETDRHMKETDRKISKPGSRIGDLVEEPIAPTILEKCNKPGYACGFFVLEQSGDTIRISVPGGFKPREW